MPRPRMFVRGNLRQKFSTSPQKATEPLPSLDSKDFKTATPVSMNFASKCEADATVRKIENRVAEIVAKSEFIEKNTRLHKLPRFSHEDLELGEMIARGGFCEVRDIKRFKADSLGLDRINALSGNKRQYVIKHLAPKLLKNKHKQVFLGAKDLVMEAYCLSALDHENILTVRGLSTSGVSAYAETCRLDGFFLVLPRLDKTLHKQLQEWRVEVNRQRLKLGQETIGDRKDVEDAAEESSNQSSKAQHNTTNSHTSTGVGIMPPEYYEEAASESSDSTDSDGENFDHEQFPFFVPRIQTAVEIASAVAYCHRNRILVRDLKPANVGYDFEEDRVKIFDFGLACELPPSRDPDEIFKLPGNTGTARYMAPEVIRRDPYGLKADVYSYCTMLQEIMALVKPFEKLTGAEVKEHVAVFGHRPPIDKTWPAPVKKMLRRGFSESLLMRPHMEEIQDMLEDLVDI